MAEDLTREEQYLGFGIRGRVASDTPFDVCIVEIRTPTNLIPFSERVDSLYSSTRSYGLPESRDDFLSWLLVRGLARARGAIVLDRLEDQYRQTFNFDPEPPPSRGDDEIQLIILRSLRRIRRLDPQHTGHMPLDAAGVCLVEGVKFDEFEYNEQRLRDRGWVEAFAMGWDDNNHNERITELGLQALEQIESEPITEEAAAVRNEPVGTEVTEYFVAHEFSLEQIDDLRAAIQAALADSGLTPYYADNELRQGHIFTDKILEKIRMSRFGIYEISNPSKPNVFLELGAGLALERPCIIICKHGTTVPADLQGLDRIEYRSYTDLTAQLKDKLNAYL